MSQEIIRPTCYLAKANMNFAIRETYTNILFNKLNHKLRKKRVLLLRMSHVRDHPMRHYNTRQFSKFTTRQAVLIFALLFSVILSIWQPANAVSRTYVGPNGGNWHDPANWSPPGVPGPGDRISIVPGIIRIVNKPASVDLSKAPIDSMGSGTVLKLADNTKPQFD